MDTPNQPQTQSQPANPARKTSAPPPAESSFAWVKWVGLLIFVAAVGWGFYQFYWKYRLPQDHVLVDRKGNRIEARLEARAGDVLKYTLLTDGSVHFISAESLSDDDQNILHGLKSELTLALPFVATFTDAQGGTYTGEILGKNAKYLKFSQQPESIVRFLPLDQLSEADAGWLRTLPNNLTFNFPVRYTLDFGNARIVEAQLTARSDKLVRVTLAGDGSTHVYPMDTLSAENQAFMRNLPITQTLSYPVEFPLTMKDGRVVDAVVQGRSSSTLRYMLVSERRTRTAPLTDFAPKTQEYLRAFPANIQDTFSADRTLTTDKGDALDVQLLGRSETLVKYKLKSNDNVYYYPISMLSPEDQQYVRQMPPSLPFDYPLDYNLMDPKTNQAVPVRITALTSTNLKYTVVAGGRSFDSPLTTFSPLDQAILRQMPLSPVDAPVAATPAAVAKSAMTVKEITQEVVNALKNSGNYGGNIDQTRLPATRKHAATAWVWLQRITGRSENLREDYSDFKGQTELQSFIREKFNSALIKLQEIRTPANASQIDTLISLTKKALENVDAITRGGGATINSVATNQIAEYMRRLESP